MIYVIKERSEVVFYDRAVGAVVQGYAQVQGGLASAPTGTMPHAFFVEVFFPDLLKDHFHRLRHDFIIQDRDPQKAEFLSSRFGAPLTLNVTGAVTTAL